MRRQLCGQCHQPQHRRPQRLDGESLPERGHPEQRGELQQADGLHRSGGVRAHHAHRPRRGRELHQHHVPQAARDPRLPAAVPRERAALAVDAVPQPGRDPRPRAHGQLRPHHLRDAESQRHWTDFINEHSEGLCADREEPCSVLCGHY